jgi:hypothetical protein
MVNILSLNLVESDPQVVPDDTPMASAISVTSIERASAVLMLPFASNTNYSSIWARAYPPRPFWREQVSSSLILIALTRAKRVRYFIYFILILHGLKLIINR